jgi:hypothetical protein
LPAFVDDDLGRIVEIGARRRSVPTPPPTTSSPPNAKCDHDVLTTEIEALKHTDAPAPHCIQVSPRSTRANFEELHYALKKEDGGRARDATSR